MSAEIGVSDGRTTRFVSPDCHSRESGNLLPVSALRDPRFRGDDGGWKWVRGRADV